jgi:hypothetical protein
MKVVKLKSPLEAMGSSGNRYGQRQLRMASLVRFRWRSEEVCEAELTQPAGRLRALAQQVGGQSRKGPDWGWQVELQRPARPARSQTPRR